MRLAEYHLVMDEHLSELPDYSEFPPGRRDGQLELRVWDASDDQLALGLATAREIFEARGVSPDRAGVCSAAVSAHESDPSLPEPDAEVRRSAAAFEEASKAAILAAGGTLDSNNEMSASQWPDGRGLWNTLPTLRAYRFKHSPSLLDKVEVPPPSDESGSLFV